MKKYGLLTLITLSIAGSISAHNQKCEANKFNALAISAITGFALGVDSLRMVNSPAESHIPKPAVIGSGIFIAQVFTGLGNLIDNGAYCSDTCAVRKTYGSIFATGIGYAVGYFSLEIINQLKNASYASLVYALDYANSVVKP